nr:NTP transferase domain-containing protein [uncultured Friedmanniella sp.]
MTAAPPSSAGGGAGAPGPERVAAVVLAGGTSRRFGRDKLVEPLGYGVSVLDVSLAELPAQAQVLLVGPDRPVARSVRFVREHPPGGGPAAALVTGLRQALADEAAIMLVLPADAPGAGRAAGTLLAALAERPAAQALVAVDDEGREQPLQLALRAAAARQLVDGALDGGHGASARALVRGLHPPAQPVPLAPDVLFDIDTLDQLAAWQAQASPAVAAVLERLAALPPAPGRPRVIALDGASGTGKSTLAAALRLRTGATVLPGDDFYAPSMAVLDAAGRDRLTGADVAARAFDWRRLRAEALEPLRAGRPARYRPFAWGAGPTPDALADPRTLPPGPVVVVDGVYSARPELADLVDLAVLVTAPEPVRAERLVARRDDPGWASLWERGERHYLTQIRPARSFALTVPGAPITSVR